MEKNTSRFKLLKVFKLTIPEEYDHNTQLGNFFEKCGKDFDDYVGGINDKNFANVTDKIIPGKTYTVKIFRINQTVSSEDCLVFLKTQEAILVGAQGLSLFWKHKKEEFPVDGALLSFDEREALWKDENSRRVPAIGQEPYGDLYFGVGDFKNSWTNVHYLLCFCN